MRISHIKRYSADSLLRHGKTWRTPRNGFTLVEMLVVVIIIGILAALLLPVIGGAIRRARLAAIAIEVASLNNLIESLKTNYGSYPPDFEEFDRNRTTKGWTWGEYQQTHSGRFMRKNFPKIGAVDIKFLLQASPGMDNSEALVFWLKGLSTNPRAPFTGPDGPGNYAIAGGQVDTRFDFDFVPTRLQDRDGDGFQEYYPPYAPAGGVPYAYFNAKSYSTSMPAALYPSLPANQGKVFIHAEHSPTALWKVTLDLSSGGTASYTAVPIADPEPNDPMGIARPQKSQEVIPNSNQNPLDTHRAASFYYVKRDAFQIISGSLDGKFGLSLSFYPSGDPLTAAAGIRTYPAVASPTIGYGNGELDNITNFSEGRTLEDLIP